MKKKSKRLHEFFEITKVAKKFDRCSGRFRINISCKTVTDLTPRTLAVIKAFEIGIDQERERILYDNVELRLRPQTQSTSQKFESA